MIKLRISFSSENKNLIKKNKSNPLGSNEDLIFYIRPLQGNTLMAKNSAYVLSILI